MKQIAVGLLSLAAIGLFAQPSFAWLMHRCCGCKYSTYICCQPYNAFTPVCFGNITGLGCCPVALNCCQPSCCQSNCGWQASCGSPCCGPSCCDSGCNSGTYYSGPSSYPLPVPGNFTPPPPTPMNGAVSYGWNQQYPMVPPYQVQQTSYYPPYNPGYYWPTAPAPMPNYWYGR